jgi:hypothetical protein
MPLVAVITNVIVASEQKETMAKETTNVFVNELKVHTPAYDNARDLDNVMQLTRLCPRRPLRNMSMSTSKTTNSSHLRGITQHQQLM